MKKVFILTVGLCLAVNIMAQDKKQRKSHVADSLTLENVVVSGKSKAQKLREGAFAVNAIDVGSITSTLNTLNTIVDKTAGVKIREEGGVGSDFDLSINGMSGNAVRYFIDGIPLDSKGSGVTLANMPVSMIDHIEIYKGVVPTWLSSDALGGAVNIVTKKKLSNYLDASYGFGSFNTHRADINGQYVTRHGIIVRPLFGYNFSKNNYMMKGVEVWDEESRQYKKANRRRFHDDYNSLIGEIEAGVRNKWWADAFFVSASYNKVDKEIQTGQLQSKVIGMADRTSDAWNLSANYQKQHFLTENLSANISLSHTWDNSVATDTAYRKYNWDGEYINSSRNEITGRVRTIRHFKRPLTIARAELNYSIAANHMISLSYALNRTGNRRWDELDKSFTPSNDVLAKHIIGLAYNQTLFNGMMNNTFFLKDYINRLHIEQTDLPSVTGSSLISGNNQKNYIGGGAGVRLKIAEPIAVKASYEHSVRLPLARELLGNGTTIYANVRLEPEKSNNANLGFFGTLHHKVHTLSYEVNGFIRYVDNYIQPQVSEKEGMMQYVNVPAVHIKGLEGELRYDYNRQLQVVANMSWQDARDRMKLKSDGKPSVTYNNHVPNRPWLFASTEATYSLNNLFSPTDCLRLGIDYQWVHWFFLSWEGYGALETKARIPEKNELGANITYSWHNQRYSFSIDCRNLLDATNYDNYKLQKPGRTLFAKFRITLQ